MGMLIHITIREHILLYNNLYANRIYFIVGIKHAGNNFNMLKKSYSISTGQHGKDFRFCETKEFGAFSVTYHVIKMGFVFSAPDLALYDKS